MALDNSAMAEGKSRTNAILLFILVSAAVLAALIGRALTNGIVGPLSTVVATLKEIADGEGDLTRYLHVRGRDEVGELASSFNRFVDRLAQMVRRTRLAGDGLTDAAVRIQQSSREVRQDARLQAHRNNFV